MSDLGKVFENGKALIPFITCGDPDLETTGRIVREAVKNGADLIVLGIPFSDPTAEGHVVQKANYRALAGGATTDRIFEFIRNLRKDVVVPMVFMTYANLVFSYGAERFIRTGAEIGMDGLILLDLPFEEKDDFLPICRKYGMSLISMIAPASNERIRLIAKEAEGFIYAVSSLGVAGIGKSITTELDPILKEARRVTDLPCAVGVGISTPEQAQCICKIADGAIVDSAFVQLIEKYGTEAAGPVGELVKKMKEAIRRI